jgi:hypothetical protein
MIAFPDRATALRSHEETLTAVNLPCGPPPDLVMRDSREWANVTPFPAVGGTRPR